MGSTAWNAIPGFDSHSHDPPQAQGGPKGAMGAERWQESAKVWGQEASSPLASWLRATLLRTQPHWGACEEGGQGSGLASLKQTLHDSKVHRTCREKPVLRLRGNSLPRGPRTCL